MFITCLQSVRIIALESLIAIAILAKIKCPLLLSSNGLGLKRGPLAGALKRGLV